MARNRQRAKDRKQKLHRENVPGSLDHVSGEVDRVEAAIVVERPGSPATPSRSTTTSTPAPSRTSASATAQAISRRPPPHPRRGAARACSTLRASGAELQRVEWPNRRQVGQATAVVLGFVVIAGAFLASQTS